MAGNESTNNDDSGNLAKPTIIPSSTIGEEDDVVIEGEIEGEQPISDREQIAREYYEREHGYTQDDEIKGEDDENTDPDIKAGEDEHPSDDPEKVEIKVNGQTRLVEREKVEAGGGVETYQKSLAADESLREAAENRRLLDDHAGVLAERERRIVERENALSEKDVQTDLPEINDDQKKVLADKAKAYREALLDGDEDNVDSLLIDLLEAGRTSTPTVDEEALVNTTVNRTKKVIDNERQNKEIVTAYTNFKRDFPDINEDEKLYLIADKETVIVKREHPNWNHAEVMTEAGHRTMEWHGVPRAVVEEEPEDRLEEKRTLSTPRASSRRKPATGGKKTETNSEYIANLRKQRGLD